MSQTPSGLPVSDGDDVTIQPPRRSFLQFIVDRNPFYLFSAVSMFAGCRIIIGALAVAAGDTRKLLWLIATLNLYEAMLIGLALFLIVRRGLQRDGWILLSIEALFLVDLTFLNGEVFTANLRLGVIVNFVCFVLALLKIAMVVRVLRLRVPIGTLAFIALQLAALFALPGVYRAIARNGSLTALQLYAGWWVVGLMPVAAALLVPRRVGATDSPMQPLPGRLYMLLPFIALLAHLAGENRVYWIHFHVANVAPVLLGLAVALGRWAPARRPVIAWMQTALVGLAVVLSASFPLELIAGGSAHHLLISPLRLALVASAGTLIYAYALHYRRLLAQLAGALLGAAALGASPDQMLRHSVALGEWVLEKLERMVPTSPLQWGVAAVATSFVLLALGAMMSLRKGAVASG